MDALDMGSSQWAGPCSGDQGVLGLWIGADNLDPCLTVWNRALQKDITFDINPDVGGCLSPTQIPAPSACPGCSRDCTPLLGRLQLSTALTRLGTALMGFILSLLSIGTSGFNCDFWETLLVASMVSAAFNLGSCAGQIEKHSGLQGFLKLRG